MNIRLPSVIQSEILDNLNQDGQVVIEGLGMFYLTRFHKFFPVITKGRGEMVLKKNRKDRKCDRVGFKPSATMKNKVL
jgi:hypothetical protein